MKKETELMDEEEIEEFCICKYLTNIFIPNRCDILVNFSDITHENGKYIRLQLVAEYLVGEQGDYL